MKWNSYTYFYKKNNETYLLYNYANDSIIFLVKELFNIVKENENDIKNLSIIHPDLYQELIEKNFIVKENFNDKEEMIKDINKRLESLDIFKLTINPTLDCNLKCWYCYETQIKNSIISQRVLNGIKEIISKKTIDRRNKTLFLSFFGGEPLLRNKKNILELVTFAQDCCNNNGKNLKVHFTTNGVLLDKKIVDKLVKITPHITVQIPFDGNKEKHNEVKTFKNGGGSYDIILNNLAYALSVGIHANIRCNFTLNNISSFKNLIDDVDKGMFDFKDRIRFQMQQVWQTESKEELDLPEKVLEIKKYIEEKNFYSNLTGKGVISTYCYADYTNSILINYNGDVFKCTARDFKQKNRIGILQESGTIFYEENHRRRLYYRFNKECLNCTILPICTICSQKRFEAKNKDKCPLNISEEDKIGQIEYRLNSLCHEYE